MPDPITPTRVIPAAELPPRPPAPGEAPPWRTPPAPPAPPAVPPPPAVVEHRHVHEIILVPAEPEPEPTRWDRTWAALQHVGRPWQLITALILSFAPVLPNRYSITVTWAYCVQTTRAEHGQGWGYALALGALTAAVWLTYRRGTVPRITALAVAFVGALGAISLYDPITWLTGVTR